MVRSNASSAPHWISRSHSSVCACVRSRKSGSDTNGPSCARAANKASSDFSETPFTCASPTRKAPRSRDAVRVAREKSQGWTGQGIGLGAAELAPGETAALFPEREAQALALPRLVDVDPLVRGRSEHERLGLTVRAHPTTLFPCPADARIAADARVLRRRIDCGEIARFRGARVTLRGWPAATRHVRTSDGRTMRFLTLEDESGLAECVIFPDVYERDGAHLAEFGTLCVSGVVQDQMGACTLQVECVH